jgi:hypothetical protein
MTTVTVRRRDLLVVSFAVVGAGAVAVFKLLPRKPAFSSDTTAASSPVDLPVVTRVPRTPAALQSVSVVTRRTDVIGEYLSWLDRTIISVDNAMANLQNLAMTEVRGPTWQLQVTGEVTVWTSAYHNAMSVDPPASLVTQHVAVVEGFSEYNRAARQVLQGATDDNDNLVASGINEAYGGRLIVGRARAAMDAVGA